VQGLAKDFKIVKEVGEGGTRDHPGFKKFALAGGSRKI